MSCKERPIKQGRPVQAGGSDDTERGAQCKGEQQASGSSSAAASLHQQSMCVLHMLNCKPTCRQYNVKRRFVPGLAENTTLAIQPLQGGPEMSTISNRAGHEAPLVAALKLSSTTWLLEQDGLLCLTRGSSQALRIVITFTVLGCWFASLPIYHLNFFTLNAWAGRGCTAQTAGSCDALRSRQAGSAAV